MNRKFEPGDIVKLNDKCKSIYCPNYSNNKFIIVSITFDGLIYTFPIDKIGCGCISCVSSSDHRCFSENNLTLLSTKNNLKGHIN
jgi:hypothetical protein